MTASSHVTIMGERTQGSMMTQNMHFSSDKRCATVGDRLTGSPLVLSKSNISRSKTMMGHNQNNDTSDCLPFPSWKKNTVHHNNQCAFNVVFSMKSLDRIGLQWSEIS